MVFVVWVGW